MEIEKMRRKSDRHGADGQNRHKSQQGDSTEFNNQSMMHWLIKANKKGKEDSAVGCHSGRRGFGWRDAVRSIYATNVSNLSS